MLTQDVIYHDEEAALHGFVAYPEGVSAPTPAVLVVHDWSGRNEFACQKAKALAELGYIGFAVDMYGEGRVGETVEEKSALMKPLIDNRQRLRDRILAGLTALHGLEYVDKARTSAIGFCFGGLTVLDLARSGATVAGVVSFHGLLYKPENMTSDTIRAKILVLHGYDDPMVPPESVTHFCQEMTVAQADWQVHMYGHTKHAFSNPMAKDEALGTVYNSVAAHRSWQAMCDFLHELFSA